MTISETAKRPPGTSTRKAARRTCRLSAERLMTQLEMTTSTAFAGRGICSISPFEKTYMLYPRFSTVAFCQFKHGIGHIQAIGKASRSNTPRREQHIDAAATAQVEHFLSRFQFRQRRWVAATKGSKSGSQR